MPYAYDIKFHLENISGIIYRKEIRQEYPNKHVTLEESRIFVLNTVFNVPEALLLATLVDYFENHSTSFEKLPNKTGYKKKDAQQQILYSTIFEDCRQTIEWIHVHGDFRKIVSENLKHYIQLDDRAVSMMKMLSQSGKKLFLLTNSPWLYTKKMMSYVMGPEWQELFDVVIADGNKPRWFLQDTPFKEVNKSTGTNLIGTYWGPFRKGDVYTAGCAALFIQQMRLAGKDILYVGDHIFGDVLKSKKTGGWRTLLIVPELDRELKVWVDQNRKFDRLLDLNSSLSRSDSADGAVKKETLKEIARLTDEMEQRYSAMGSIMRSGWRLTHFASQLRRYADMYTCNVYNLADYSPSFYFNSPIYLLPHEEKFMPSAEQVEDTDAAPEEVCNCICKCPLIRWQPFLSS
ncbi:unnamed protein product [Heligmosomoides polygyrus]|uniref:5'-nucleotidase domain-containing protein 1 n=1 Tax=Heligmosomoides polygyrus TaxID=6339 RepID=A0A183G347_HELPZ|nr:unnamed protein product [Heligmosomoides polygyrus]